MLRTQFHGMRGSDSDLDHGTLGGGTELPRPFSQTEMAQRCPISSILEMYMYLIDICGISNGANSTPVTTSCQKEGTGGVISTLYVCQSQV